MSLVMTVEYRNSEPWKSRINCCERPRGGAGGGGSGRKVVVHAALLHMLLDH